MPRLESAVVFVSCEVMSIAELKKTADGLSAREKQWLRSYLFASERSESGEWKRSIVEKRKSLLANATKAGGAARRKARSAA